MEPIPKRFLKWILVFAFAEILHMAVLYQLEIIMIWISNDIYHFEFPFYIGGSISVWVARDFWYLCDFISRIIGYLALYKLVANYKERLIRMYKHYISKRYGTKGKVK